ncbi:hypothetical protein GCM10010124_32170 [Pilimelia terevasa]|uniref:Uncharacterized protein n=1 Tax=Pilimelia terevasa TaxID=53372 RepID=A0A8J3BUI8_9ACTN|nr:LPXTG cell wall anchor domain-containing protein [Pilimelia terevasa]GGK37062.1 hypothetical protein GCM10010124_32170 [Pilimelia terevasa]
MSGHQELPVTGASGLVLGAVGVVMVALGALLTFAARAGARVRGALR